MKRKIKYYKLVWLKYDLPAGLSVFLVALPLCLGIALASGAPLSAGLLSGIIGGIVVASISGSKLAVSGPAAGLTTLVASSIISLGDYRLFLLTIIIAGIFQILLGVLKLGTIASYFPSSVIKGMLAAIGIILISKQIPVAIGYDQPHFWTSELFTFRSSHQLAAGIKNLGTHITPGAIFISSISVLILILFQQPFAKKIRIVPPPLLVVVVGILANFVFMKISSPFTLERALLVNVPSNLISSVLSPDLSKIFSYPEIWKDGLSIGILATLETLLCIEAIDKLDKHNNITPVNRELVAQGIGNTVCGFLGALPITAVVVRGAANVDAGARTKLSAITHGLFLFLTVLLVPSVLNLIPYASLSAILLITGYNLTKPKLYKYVWKSGWTQFLPFIITIVIVLATDLLIGVSIGLLISIYFIVRKNFKAEYKIIKSKHEGLEHYTIKLNTNVTFLNKVNLTKSLDQIPEDSTLTIDGSECNFIDYDILEMISEFGNKADDRNINLILKGITKVDVTAIH